LRVFQHGLYKLLIFIVHPPIKVPVLDVTFLVQMLKAHNSGNSSSTESCFSQRRDSASLHAQRSVAFGFVRQESQHAMSIGSFFFSFFLFLLCLPVWETETIMSGRESLWDTKALQMSLSQKARLYCLTH